MKNEIFKRTAAFGLAVFLTLTSTPGSMVTAFADPVSGSEESVMAASAVSSGSADVTANNTEAASSDTEIVEPDTGAEIVKAQTAEEFADQIAEVPKDSRIMIRTDEELSGVISSGEAVQMQDVAIASFDTDAEKDQAVSELEEAGISVSEDDLVTIQDEGGQAEGTVRNGTGKKVALIDTGVNGIDTIDLTGEGTQDDNGHGTRMAQAIEEAADRKADILSIKAIGADGKGSLSKVYAAIKVAMEQGAEIINLSFNMADNDNTKEAKALINEAIASGITVVAAAGNQGADASSYFPGNIFGVITIGACSEDGKVLNSSNRGNVVDCWVRTEATSRAAAVVSGFLASGGKLDGTLPDNILLKPVEEAEADPEGSKVNDDTDKNQDPVGDQVYVQEVVTSTSNKNSTTSVAQPTGASFVEGRYTVSGSNYGDVFCISATWYKNGTKTVYRFQDYWNSSMGGNIDGETALKKLAAIHYWIDEHYPASSIGESNNHFLKQIITWNWLIRVGSAKAAKNGAYHFPSNAEQDARRQDIEANGFPWMEANYDKMEAEGYIYSDGGATQELTSLKYSMKPQVGNLQIKKIVSSGDQNRDFTVNVHVDGASGQYDYTGSRSGKISFGGNGNASLTISGGQTITIGGLPKDAAYTLTETMPDDYYQVTASGTTGTIIAGQTVTGAFTNEQYGYVYLHKVSGDKNLTEKNSCYSLKGATYGLYDSKGTLVHTLTTNENGDTEIFKVVPGDYTAKELQASTGYMKDEQPHTVHVTSANTKEHPAEITSSEPPINDPVEWKLQKQDAEVGDLTQGLTSLENAKFTVTFYSGYFDSESAAEGAVKSGSVTKRTWYLVTKYDADRKAYIASLDPDHLDPDKKSDDFYRNQSKQIIFPRGTFWVKETQAPEGYNNDSALSGAAKLIRIEKGGDAQTGLNKIIPYAVAENSNKVEDNPIRADFHLTKLDIDGNAKPYTPFWIIAYNKDGKEVERHLVVSDANGVISTASTYSYEASDGSGATVTLNKPHTQETISKLGALEKEVKNNVLSAAGEAKLKEAANWGVWFSQGLDKDGNVVTGSRSVPNNSRPSCYYGSYRVIEIQCASNREKQENLMDSGIFSLTKEGINYKEATIIDTEIRLTSVASNADDDGTETKTVAEGENISIRDRISYTHVTAGKPYRMELSIVDLDDQEGNSPKVLATTTKDFTPKKISGTANTSGSMTMTLSGIDTVGREGHALLAVVRLHQFVSNGASVNETKADVIVAEHGVEQDDPREKVYVPKMHTTAEDALTGDHVGARDKKDAVKDTVELTDLAPKTNYKLVMTLTDKSTGKALTDADGKELSVEKKFNTESEDFKPSRTSTIPTSTEEDEDAVLVDAVSGKVEMPELVLDSTKLFGKTIIVTETLYRTDSKGELMKGTNPVLVHPDWHADQTEVESQSIHYPDLATNAIDGHNRADNLYQVGTADQVGTVGQTTFSDTMKVTNLLPGMSYKVSGVLLDRQASEEAGMPVAYTYTDAEGKEQTVTQETVIMVSKDGREIKASNGEHTTATYHPEKNSTNGTVELIFTLDASGLDGKDLVAAEMLYHSYKNGTDKDKKDEIPVAEHKNYEDRDQMVYYPNIGTKAIDRDTEDHVGTVNVLSVK